MTGSRSEFVEHDGVRLHTLVDGPDDAPPVVLLHGITSHVHTWNWLVPHLTSIGRRTVRLDFRGHGRSDRTPGEYHLKGYTADAVAVCERTGPAVVIGHSLGGATAAGLAQTRPDLVRAAVLEDPPIGAPRRLEGNSLLDGFKVMRDIIPLMQASGVTAEVLASRIAEAPSPNGPSMGQLLHPDGILAMASSNLLVDASVLDPVLQGGLPAPVFDRDRAMPVPTLLIAADPTVPGCVAGADDVAHFASLNPDATVITMTGAGHLVHDELAHRDAFRAAVLAFVGEH